MIGKIVKAVAYSRAPKTTFTMMHPRKALKYGALLWLGKKLVGSRDRSRTA